MFGSEVIPALALLILLFFVPESPRWLANKSRSGEALAVLARVSGDDEARREMAGIQQSLEKERGSIRQLLTGRMRVALIVGVVLAVLQQVTGVNVFIYYAPEIFKGIAGSGTDVALLQTVVLGAVNLVFTVIAIWTVDRLGRKPLMLVGYAGMGITLLGLGFYAYFERTDAWALILVLGYIASFAGSVGPVNWVILAEIFPTRVRGRAMSIATGALWIANYVVSQTFPMMDQNRTLIKHFNHAFPFWLYAILCLMAILFIARFVPETKGKSLEEADSLWSVAS